MVRATHPDFVLVDVGLQGERGIGLVGPLTKLQPGVRIVLMGDGDSTEYVHAAEEVGALAYLPKKSVSQRLPELLGITEYRADGVRGSPERSIATSDSG
jgi:DNA-binding NarL/FixJ family response regulator